MEKHQETTIVEVEYPNLGKCTIEVKRMDSYTIETSCTLNHRRTRGEGVDVATAIDHACRRMLSIVQMPDAMRERFRHLYEIV